MNTGDVAKGLEMHKNIILFSINPVGSWYVLFKVFARGETRQIKREKKVGKDSFLFEFNQNLSGLFKGCTAEGTRQHGSSKSLTRPLRIVFLPSRSLLGRQLQR